MQLRLEETTHHIKYGEGLVLPGSIAYPPSAVLVVVGGDGGETCDGQKP